MEEYIGAKPNSILGLHYFGIEYGVIPLNKITGICNYMVEYLNKILTRGPI